MIVSPKFPGLAVLALVTLLSACASQKEPAEEAVANIDTTFGAASGMAEKYLPDSYAEVRGRVEELKASLAREDYKAVMAAAPEVAAAVRKLIADSAMARAETTKKLGEEWTQLATTMPGTITAIDDKILGYTSRSAVPKGMSRDDFKALVAKFDAARAVWGQAAESGNAGKYEDAVTKTHEIQQTIDEVKAALGMAAG